MIRLLRQRALLGLAACAVVRQQAASIAFSLDIGKFPAAERAYYIRSYGVSRLQAAFESSLKGGRRI